MKKILYLATIFSLLGCTPNSNQEIPNINLENLIIPEQLTETRKTNGQITEFLNEITYPIFRIKTAIEHNSYDDIYLKNVEATVNLNNQTIQELTKFVGKEIVKTTSSDFNLAMYSVLVNKPNITYNHILYTDIADYWLNLNPLTCAISTSHHSHLSNNIDCFYEINKDQYFHVAKITIERNKENENEALLKVVFNQPTSEKLQKFVYDYNYIVDKMKSMPNANNFYHYGILQNSKLGGSSKDKARKRHTYTEAISLLLNPIQQRPDLPKVKLP